MVKKQKLYQRLINNQKNVNFNDLLTILNAFGFTLERVTGSHHIFSHPSVSQAVSVQPDHGNQAKAYQVKQLLRLIEVYNLRMTDRDEGGE